MFQNSFLSLWESLGITTGYGLDDGGVGVRVPVTSVSSMLEGVLCHHRRARPRVVNGGTASSYRG
jgi:hypothetical protein